MPKFSTNIGITKCTLATLAALFFSVACQFKLLLFLPLQGGDDGGEAISWGALDDNTHVVFVNNFSRLLGITGNANLAIYGPGGSVVVNLDAATLAAK